jgi:hypothetical protein
MEAVRHSPAYVMPLQGTWRVIVPIRGRLSPKVLTPEFATRAAASEWLESAEGQSVVAFERRQKRQIMPARNPAPAAAQSAI